MGRYTNPGNAAFKQNINSEIYIDMTGLISFCNKQINTNQRFVCVSRPRRFGKSMTANMLTAYYGRGYDSKSLFDGFEIAGRDSYQANLNRYNTLYINMQNFVSSYKGVTNFLDKLNSFIARDLIKEYPDIDYFDNTSLTDVMTDIFTQTGISFVIIIDEWDCIFREYKEDTKAQNMYLDFLRNWFKDRDYVGLCYMTGILPIKKYGTQSALNMFSEFSMENPGELAKYIGFSTDQVKNLCDRYCMDFDECRTWYDGYSFPGANEIYNPKSVVEAMMRKRFGTYWNQTESFDALRLYIDMNYEGLRDAVISMMAGNKVKIDTGSFSNDMTTFHSADDIMTLLIHLGYLAYDIDTSEVYIPNNEIMQVFGTATSVSKWDEVYIAVKQSDDLLKATWRMDEEAVAAGVQEAHLETNHLQYNDENALSYTISLAYFSAREYYTIVRELPTGEGFADMVFIPRKNYRDKPAIIIELKWNKDAETAIAQIRKKQYVKSLSDYKGNILLVGINYDKVSKEHTCKIEKLAM